jgi:hypothetical protein
MGMEAWIWRYGHRGMDITHGREGVDMRVWTMKIRLNWHETFSKITKILNSIKLLFLEFKGIP